jgi:hypothetical protein
MQSPAITYLRIKLSKEMSEMKPDSGMSFSTGIKPEDDLGYDVMAKPGMGMAMGGKPDMMMGGKPGMGMAMGGKPDMMMGGKPGKGGKPGMSMKEEKMLRGGKQEKMPMGRDRSPKDMEISPEEIQAMNAAEQGNLASRVARTLGFSGPRLDSVDAAANLGRSALNFV